MKLFVGTSGFSYGEWKGDFYPAEAKATDFLALYAGRLPAVEINNTFHRLPKRAQLESWADQVPADFRFVIKASRRITHVNRLKGIEQPLSFLLKNTATLGDRLGALLFQMPPYLRKDLDLLRDFLALIPASFRAALEFRHRSWLDDEVVNMVRDHGQAICIADGEKVPVPEKLVSTTDWGYLRLRRSEYSDDELSAWVRRIREQAWGSVYVFFKDETDGFGPRQALRLSELFAAAEPPFSQRRVAAPGSAGSLAG